jgi:hypothetical protein
MLCVWPIVIIEYSNLRPENYWWPQVTLLDRLLKVSLEQALRLCTGRNAHRGIEV